MVQVSLERDTVATHTPTSSTSDGATDGRWRRYDRYAWILVATIVAALVAATGAGDGADTATGRLGGDYPAFYGAGSIVLDGDVGDLYDPERQLEAQEGLLGEGDVLFFAYPPPVAAAYAVFAAMPYRLSYLVHSLLMLGALGGSLLLLRPVVPAIRRFPGIALLLALGFYPMLRAVTGGQNTALTVLLVVLALRLDHDDRPLLAGLAVAALLYKPQFGIPIVALLLVPPRWAVLRGWGLGAGGFYVAGAAVAGPGWVSTWWSEATAFAEINEGVNGFLFISVPGMIANWLGTGTTLGAVATGVGLVLAAALVLLIWMRTESVSVRWAFAGAAVVLVLPQALYYEAGLLVPAAVVAGAGPLAISAIWMLSWTQIGADALGWSPLGIIMPTALVWLVMQRARTERLSA